jgi:predicted KAP-like P-loop ATPase
MSKQEKRELLNLSQETSYRYAIRTLFNKSLLENKEAILFEFDPWYLATEDAILAGFLEGLGRQLRPVSAKFKKMFEKYFKQLSIGTPLGQISCDIKEEGLLELKENISSAIFKSGKKIIIIINDIDRLQPAELLLVFKLVRLVGDFKKTIFILSFDYDAVRSSLETRGIGSDYINKMVHKPVTLPKMEPSDIDRVFNDEFNNLFESMRLDARKTKEELEGFSYTYQGHARNLFNTLRSVKRYINSLATSLPPVVDEVHLYDFAVLELIKVFLPKLYDDIYINWWFYVSERGLDEEGEKLLLPIHFSTEEDRGQSITEHLKQLIGSGPQAEIFRHLLGRLFPHISRGDKRLDYRTIIREKEKARLQKRIYSTSFLKYFTLKVPANELSDLLIENIIASWNAPAPSKRKEVDIRQGLNKAKK